jgi:hypothetical protein
MPASMVPGMEMTLLKMRRVCGRLAGSLERIAAEREIRLVCILCRRIRNEQGNWVTGEQFLLRQTEANLSSGICPDCFQRHFQHFG